MKPRACAGCVPSALGAGREAAARAEAERASQEVLVKPLEGGTAAPVKLFKGT
ncbi:MAG: hypothetical protein MI784_15015 [Cytophagales bacterium]|nr:hypothetical protein [Cytophagales bacterium]